MKKITANNALKIFEEIDAYIDYNYIRL